MFIADGVWWAGEVALYLWDRVPGANYSVEWEVYGEVFNPVKGMGEPCATEKYMA